MMERLEVTPASASQVRIQTARDPLLSKVKRYVMLGWPLTKKLPPELLPFIKCKDELGIQDDCLMWGGRVVVPFKLQRKVTDKLHTMHLGISRMKSLARQHVWWPGIDLDIEKMVKGCNVCQTTRHNPPAALLHPWEWPQQPWQCVHADYAGPFLGRMFLILVDAYSKWVDVHVVHSSTFQVTIEKMRTSFATSGLPQTLVTDNGTQFTRAEFSQFTILNGIEHVMSSPYHPSTNGLAERTIQSFKEGMKRQSNGSIETHVARFLFAYHSTPHFTTRASPAMLMFNRPLRSHLDLLKPDIHSAVQDRQFQQKLSHDVRCKDRQFNIGDSVFTKNLVEGPSGCQVILMK